MSDIFKKIKELEEKGEYNTHLRPINWEEAKPIGADFPYIPKGKLKLKYSLINFFIVRPFRRYQAKCVYKTKVTGKQLIKDVRSAIVVCNHIAIFDCLALSFALKNRKVKFVAGEFNNKNSWFGETMRAHGILPLSNKLSVLKKFNNALEHYLLHDNLVVIYPEESMWDLYKKPRPFKKGAFYYAAKFNVPVIPVFITLREPDKKKTKGRNDDLYDNQNGITNQNDNLSGNQNDNQNDNLNYQKSNQAEADFTENDLKKPKYFTINFSQPVYPRQDLTLDENTEYLKDAAYSACANIYERVYNKKLIF